MAKGTSERRNTGQTRKGKAGATTRTRQAAPASTRAAAEHVTAVALPGRAARPVTAASRSTGAASPVAPAKAPPGAAAASRSSAPQPSPQPGPYAATPTKPTSSPSRPVESPAGGAAERGTGGYVLAGLLGGLIAFALMLAAEWFILAPGADNDSQAQITALSQDVSTLEQAISRLEEAQGGNEEVAALQERVAALENTPAAEPDTERLDTLASDQTALADRLTALEEQVADRSAEERVNRAFAAAQLKSAIDRGGAFGAELQAYGAVAPDDPAVAALSSFAEGGVPTRNALVERFPDVATRMLNAVNAGDPDAGVLDRLMTSARSVVTVRPTGAVEGDTPEAKIARMEASLNEGDFAAAISEWETLPEAAKAVSEDYVADLRARGEAEKIVSDTLSAASEAIAAETN